MERLHSIDPELTETLLALDASKARDAAIRFAEFSIQTVGMSEPIAVDAIGILKDGSLLSSQTLERLSELADQYDDAYFDTPSPPHLDDTKTAAAYSVEFAKARTCDAIRMASKDDPHGAAVEAAYEAWAATNSANGIAQLAPPTA
jgi:hypothetical protein